MNYGNLGIVDVLKDMLEAWMFAKGVPQRLFGDFPDMDSFLEHTSGIITIAPQVSLVAPVSAARYPIEADLCYTASPNGKLKPVFGKGISYSEHVRRVSCEELSQGYARELQNELMILAEHRKLRIELSYERPAVADFRNIKK